MRSYLKKEKKRKEKKSYWVPYILNYFDTSVSHENAPHKEYVWGGIYLMAHGLDKEGFQKLKQR